MHEQLLTHGRPRPPWTATLAVAPVILPGVALRPLPPAGRVSLRALPDDVATVSQTIGLTLPRAPLTSTCGETCSALWLGPDEWLLLADSEWDPHALVARLTVATAGRASFVDVSQRQAGIEVSGADAAELLNEGCPLDLSDAAFAPGACTRTVFSRVEIVLWRPGAEPRFRIEVWRSYAAHLWAHLVHAARDLEQL